MDRSSLRHLPSQVSNPASSCINNASKKMPRHFLPATNHKRRDFSWISIGVLRRIKYFSSFSLHPNQQQPSRRPKPKSIDAMVLLPSISVENYSVRLHCMELGMRKTSTTSPSSIAVISTVSESLFGNWDANKNLVVKYTTP